MSASSPGTNNRDKKNLWRFLLHHRLEGFRLLSDRLFIPPNLRAARVRRRNLENGRREVAHPMSFSPTRVSGRREGAHPAREGVGVGRRPSSASGACARGMALAGRTEPFDGSGLPAPLLLGGHLPA